MIMKYTTISFLQITLMLFILNSFDQTEKETQFWNEESNPEKIGKMVVDDLLSRPEIMRYETDFLSTVHYAEAISGMGALEFASFLDDTLRICKLKERYQPVLVNAHELPANHVDANVVGVLPLQFYLFKENPEYLKAGLHMADIQWENPRDDGLSSQTRFWIDDMYMIGMLQKKAYEVTGNTVYLKRAAKQYAAYLERLQQPNGLFFHGEEAPFFWGRGNGWVAVALAEILEVLPPENEHFENISDGYQKMMKALVEYQSGSGMWRQLIDYDEAWEESSATAMFGYAIKLGVDRGILEGENFTVAYQKAWTALADRLNEEGQLPDICVGTGKSDDIQYYLDRPTVNGDLHGQAPMLWFALSLLQNS